MGLISRVSSRTYRNPENKMIIPTNDRPSGETCFKKVSWLPRKIPDPPTPTPKFETLRHESSSEPQIQRIRQGKLHLATLSLGLDRRRYHLPSRTTQSPRKRYAKHLETNPRTTGPTRPTTKQSRRRTTSLRKPRWLPTKPRRWCR